MRADPAPAVPLATLAVRVAVRVPVAAGENVRVPRLQEVPLVREALAQVPAATENSLALVPLTDTGVAFNVTGPPDAVMVAVPVHEALKPADAVQLTPLTPTVAVPAVPTPVRVAVEPVPWLVLGVTVAERVPVAVGWKVMVPRAQEAYGEPVQLPAAIEKSDVLKVTGGELTVNELPVVVMEAVVAVQVEVLPTAVFGQLKPLMMTDVVAATAVPERA